VQVYLIRVVALAAGQVSARLLVFLANTNDCMKFIDSSFTDEGEREGGKGSRTTMIEPANFRATEGQSHHNQRTLEVPEGSRTTIGEL
jgi:hypothetical protein